MTDKHADRVSVVWMLLNAAAHLGTVITQEEIGELLEVQQSQISGLASDLRDRGVAIYQGKCGARLEDPQSSSPWPMAWAATLIQNMREPEGWPDRCKAVFLRAQILALPWSVL